MNSIIPITPVFHEHSHSSQWLSQCMQACKYTTCMMPSLLMCFQLWPCILSCNCHVTNHYRATYCRNHKSSMLVCNSKLLLVPGQRSINQSNINLSYSMLSCSGRCLPFYYFFKWVFLCTGCASCT